MRTSFTVRLYNYTRDTCTEDIDDITISGITIVSKPEKFGGVCLHLGNQKKFKYQMNILGRFSKVAGSHSYPILFFNPKVPYIDIELINFPRYPSYPQCKYHARNVMNGFGHNGINNGFPKVEQRKVDFIYTVLKKEENETH
tara:strand:- start:830 stop:1255 length:426 start_codon:yes stop_codon:yes gene_type:complete